MPDTTPPTVLSTTPANGAKSVAASAVVTATFSEALTASTVTTSTFVLRDPLNNLVSTNVSYDAATKTATLAPTAALQPETEYSARLIGGSSGIKDAAGNALAADYVWSFTTASLPTGFVDTLPADFSRGTLDAGGYIAETANGELTLAPVVGAEFSGTALPSGWTMSTWAGNSAATVSSGTMKVDGALVGTSAQYAAGRSLEFIATFSGAPFQHAGFAVTFGEGLWAMFSSNSGDALYARTNNASTATNTAIPGSWFGAPHRFRIDWTRVAGRLLHRRHAGRVARHRDWRDDAAGGERLRRRRQSADHRLDAPVAIRVDVDVSLGHLRRRGGHELEFGGLDRHGAGGHDRRTGGSHRQLGGAGRELERLHRRQRGDGRHRTVPPVPACG